MKNERRNSWRARVECVVTITKECNTQRTPTHSLLRFTRVFKYNEHFTNVSFTIGFVKEIISGKLRERSEKVALK